MCSGTHRCSAWEGFQHSGGWTRLHFSLCRDEQAAAALTFPFSVPLTRGNGAQMPLGEAFRPPGSPRAWNSQAGEKCIEVPVSLQISIHREIPREVGRERGDPAVCDLELGPSSLYQI